ncbi:acyl-CoA carboxylase subunit epsilon [Gordonia sp. TBRC 11910]|uniref:Acyl-CoA carboxylase subunit epsilon n=1 Tax=Gordonia asplenii TaxID=2725283 RepID=A0A848KSL0_9ACTN|nr:acyl-CoA carboxylase subunit epsilon [Gordonia asplenii]NMO01129.1 acyl-CoA carboxylase subunit epsilon [Gordonia asplenii]
MTDDAATPATEKAPAPLLRVVSGNPTDEDLAVLVTVFAGASGGSAEPGPQIRDDWGHPLDRLRPTWSSPTGFSNQRW